jgi:hypothetical protein
MFNWFQRRPVHIAVEETLRNLEAMGYLKFTAEQDRDHVRWNLLSSMKQGYLDADWHHDGVSIDRRCYPADTEDLAEGEIATCLLLMKPVLEQEGVRFSKIRERHSEKVHELRIDGEQFTIVDAPHSQTEWYWANAAKRLCEIVNELLQRADSPERLYGVYGGNDGLAMFLTPQMHAYISSLPFIDKTWLPHPSEAIDLLEFE